MRKKKRKEKNNASMLKEINTTGQANPKKQVAMSMRVLEAQAVQSNLKHAKESKKRTRFVPTLRADEKRTGENRREEEQRR